MLADRTAASAGLPPPRVCKQRSWDLHLEPLISVALAIGLRQGEALGLRWKDVDLTKRHVRVQHTLQRVGHEYVLTPPKTAQSRRTIALPAFAIDALLAHRDRQAFERQRAVEWGDRFDLVFTTVSGHPLHGPTVTKRFQRLLRAADVAPMRFHDLRHSCASLLLAQGVPLSTIMDTLGHSTITTTRDVYVHLGDELRDEAATAMDVALGGS